MTVAGGPPASPVEAASPPAFSAAAPANPPPVRRRIAPRAAAPLAAFVLHRYDWSETSLIVDLFTREAGRIVVVAKGAKRPTSQLRPVLLPFQRLLASVGRVPRGQEAGEVQTLRGAEWAGGVPTLRGEALFSGFYLNELLMKLLARQDAHPAVFDNYAATLPALSGPDDQQSQAALRAFELTLLRETGLLPDARSVTATQVPVLAAARYAFDAEAGLRAAGADEPWLSGDDCLRLQAALDGGRLDTLRLACSPNLAPLRSQLRDLLHYHLGTPMLRTRQVMLDVQRLTASRSPNLRTPPG